MNKQRGTRLTMTILLVLVTETWFCYGQNVYGATPVEIQQWLQAHNQYRSLHGVPPVTWSATVAASAQAWANTCPFSHSSTGYGENMAWASYVMTIPNVVKAWYDEEPLYDYNNPGPQPGTGHFTQVVWKSTTHIGCGYRTGCGGGGWPNVWVCQYSPAGNVAGNYAANVFPKSAVPPPPGTANIIPIITSLLLAEQAAEQVVLNQAGSVTQNNWVYYVVNALASYSKIIVELYNLSQDADLYVRQGANPTPTTYDCRSYLIGTNPETCILPYSGATTWHIGVFGYAPGTTNYTVKATLFN